MIKLLTRLFKESLARRKNVKVDNILEVPTNRQMNKVLSDVGEKIEKPHVHTTRRVEASYDIRNFFALACVLMAMVCNALGFRIVGASRFWNMDGTTYLLQGRGCKNIPIWVSFSFTTHFLFIPIFFF